MVSLRNLLLGTTMALASAIPNSSQAQNFTLGKVAMGPSGSSLVVVEGKSTWNDFSLYGFQDRVQLAEGTEYYQEVRANYNLGLGLGIAAEYNGGTHANDGVRFGATWKPDLHDSNFTLLKGLPYETSGKGPQLSVFSEQTFQGSSASVLVDWNLTEQSAYSEVEARWNINDSISLMGQLRMSMNDGERTKIAPYVGSVLNF